MTAISSKSSGYGQDAMSHSRLNYSLHTPVSGEAEAKTMESAKTKHKAE